MNSEGYFGIGIENGKKAVNYGTLFRTALILGANLVYIIGARFQKQSSDTTKSWRHIPTYEYTSFEDFNTHRPHGCLLIGVELCDTSTPLKDFKHPKRACYLLGAEDHGLSKSAMNLCQELVVLPGKESLNVSVAGSIVLYDRITKGDNL